MQHSTINRSGVYRKRKLYKYTKYKVIPLWYIIFVIVYQRFQNFYLEFALYMDHKIDVFANVFSKYIRLYHRGEKRFTAMDIIPRMTVLILIRRRVNRL